MQDLHDRRSEKGLSLLQVSLALAVVSILIVPILEIYKINKAERLRRENNQRLEEITYALNLYAQQNQRLPVPADPTKPLTDANYGDEAGTNTNTLACAAIFGALNIRCVVNANNVSADPDPASPNPGGHEVLVGSVPFRALGLNEKSSYDTYGNKITYAVTRDLVTKATYSNDKGAIGILNQAGQPLNNNPMTDPTNNKVVTTGGSDKVLFVVLNHGVDQKGAYNKNGVLSACDTVGLDVLNCDRPAMNGVFRGQDTNIPNPTPGTPASQPGPFLQDGSGTLYTQATKSYSLTPGANYYDDMLTYRTTNHDTYWSGLRNIADTTESIFTSSPVKTAIGAPLLATNDDLPKASLDVTGNVQAYRAVTESICDTLSGRCFRTQNITSPTPDPGSGSLTRGVSCENAQTMTQMNDANDGVSTGPTYDMTKSGSYIKRTCEDAPKVPAPGGGSLNTSSCPYGMKGWKATGQPDCR